MAKAKDPIRWNATKKQAADNARIAEIKNLVFAETRALATEITEIKSAIKMLAMTPPIAVPATDPRVTDYCAKCGESPDSGSHLFNHDYVPPGSPPTKLEYGSRSDPSSTAAREHVEYSRAKGWRQGVEESIDSLEQQLASPALEGEGGNWRAFAPSWEIWRATRQAAIQRQIEIHRAALERGTFITAPDIKARERGRKP